MRETIEYRDTVEALNAYFGGKGVVTRAEVVRYTGRCSQWVKDRLNVGKDGISIAVLARRLVDLSE